MFSWSVEASYKTTAAKEKIWDLWADVPNWPQWDIDLEWSKLEGPFATGGKGSLKPKGGPTFSFKLTQVVPYRSFSVATSLPLTTILFAHILEKGPDGTHQIRHYADCKGLLAPLLFLTLRRSLKKGLPLSVHKISEMAEV